MQLTTPQTSNPLKAGGLASLAGHLADYGRNGDTYIVHAAEGETVIPMEILDSNPQLKQMLFNQMRNMGIEPERYIVGNELNSINPVTGQPEFFLKKIGKGLKKALKKLAPLIGFAAGAYAQQRFAPNSRLGASLIPGATTALATKLAGGSTGKSLAYGGLGALAGSAMFDPKLGAFASRPSTSPLAPIKRVPVDGTGVRTQVYALGEAPQFSRVKIKDNFSSVPTGAVNTNIPTGAVDSVIKRALAELDPSQINSAVLTKAGELKTNTGFLMLDPVAQRQAILNLPAELAPARKGGFLPNIHPALKLAGLGGLGYLAMKEGKRDDVDLSRLKSIIDAEREMGTQTGFDLMAENPSQYGFDPRSFVPFGDLSLLPPDVLAEAIRNFGPAVNAAKGGYIDVVKADQGGEIVGPGTGTSDSIPAMLSDGEFVMTANAVKGAGGSDRREGARKMYQMMKRFEGAQGGLARAY